MFDIQENLKKLPDTPGVYIHKDKMGQVIYVGKAISLKNRVRQYFRSSKNMDPKVKAMVSNIEEFEYITCMTEMEALILECNLIKKYMPKYNVLLRDDKTYPYIKVTTNEEYPRIVKTRIVENDGCRYFGPYSDAGAVNEIVNLLNDIYSFKLCSLKSFPDGCKPCLNYHINKCRGICIGQAHKDEYLEAIGKAIDFLSGKQKNVVDMLNEKMKRYSELMDFEAAAKVRDQIMAIKAISEKQRVVMLGVKDMDLILPIRGMRQDYGVIFFVRNGRLSGRESFPMQAIASDKNVDLVAQFIKQYYVDCPAIPSEILVEEMPDEEELIQEYLSKLAGKNVKLTMPQKGDKKALLDLAKRDTIEMGKSIDERAQAAKERASAINDEICKLLSETGFSCQNKEDENRQYRIEAYDISNTNGVDSVGAMVVFEGAKRVKKDYRRFRVKTIEGPNDYGSLQEVIYRRFKRAEIGDAGFSILPDILFIDGGKGQVTAVTEILLAMKITIPTFGMAKDDHHRTRALISISNENIAAEESLKWQEISLKERPLLFKYVGTIQEEVHRFAIEYHRGLRGKNAITSVLDSIPGIGPARRNALLEHFGSVEKIKQADISKLMEVDGITAKVAEKITEYFH